MSQGTSALSRRIEAVLSIDPSSPAIEFESRWRSWGDLATTVRSVAETVPGEGAMVGILLRNRPVQVGFLLGVLLAGGCVVAINPQRGIDRTRRDIADLDLPWLAGDPDDLATLVDGSSGATFLSATDLGQALGRTRGAEGIGDSSRSGVAVRMLTSGTTGPPKRIDLSYATLERVLSGAKHYEANRSSDLRLRTGVAVVNSPLVHLGGLFRILQCVNDGRPFSLLERFTVDGWVDAVKRHRPQTVSLVPTALRMVLEADVDPDDLKSVRSVVSGTAPLSPDDADAFTTRYRAPVLISYAATEFGGGVAGWNLADHKEYWSSKRGSVGRAHAGCELRIVEPDSGDVLKPDEEGLLEVKAGQLEGTDWIRTTDLARLDPDGFLFIVGRSDQAIIRGGFKVHPDDIRSALERHPRVRGAAVVSIDDPRLGAVPAAVVELRPGPTLRPEELLKDASGTLARYELPAEIVFVDELPRTASGKVDLTAVRLIVSASEGGTP
jgi:acyl-CoA synthetase (AMP-forming)/AMP-acid ligase II